MEQGRVLELFDRRGNTIYRVALSYLRSPQEAEALLVGDVRIPLM